MKRTYKNIELTKESASLFKEFLKRNKIQFESSACFDLIHFEILVNDEETEICENWLARHYGKEISQ